MAPASVILSDGHPLFDWFKKIIA